MIERAFYNHLHAIKKSMPITIAIYGSLVIFMVNISYYNPAYINSLFSPKPTYLFR